jgi:hypothetical protein
LVACFGDGGPILVAGFSQRAMYQTLFWNQDMKKQACRSDALIRVNELLKNEIFVDLYEVAKEIISWKGIDRS